MFDFLKRSQLVRRGLASRKTAPPSRPQRIPARGWNIRSRMKLVLFAGFICRPGCPHLSADNQPEPTKNFVIALLFFLIALMMLWINQPRTFSQNSRILLVFGVMLVQLALTKAIFVLCNSGVIRFATDDGGIDRAFCLRAALLSVLLGRNHGFYAAVFVSLWSSVLLAKSTHRCSSPD